MFMRSEIIFSVQIRWIWGSKDTEKRYKNFTNIHKELARSLHDSSTPSNVVEVKMRSATEAEDESTSETARERKEKIEIQQFSSSTHSSRCSLCICADTLSYLSGKNSIIFPSPHDQHKQMNHSWKFMFGLFFDDDDQHSRERAEPKSKAHQDTRSAAPRFS